MITYELIKAANETLPRMDIKGKQYAIVPARVQAFRQMCPNGSIETEIVSLVDGVVTMKTTVKDEDGHTLATGFAQEKESSSYINKTSYIENCETSAVGRALGMIGIGSEYSMASAEEMVNALNNQDKTEKVKASKINATEAKAIKEALDNAGIEIDRILEHFNLKSIQDMTMEQFRATNDMIGKYTAKK